MLARLLLSAALLVSLSACATGARPSAMTASISSDTVISDTSSLRKSITVVEVSGGKETNPLWTSQVDNAAFKDALEQSLTLHAMIAETSPRYNLEAKLLELDQPFGGFNMTVGSRVFYRLADATSNERVYETEINCEYTAELSDAFLGYERLKLANEGAIKKNIALFIEALVVEMNKRDAAAAVPSAQLAPAPSTSGS